MSKIKRYTPKPEDLIFFDLKYVAKLNHVGIVEKVDYFNVYIIEDNSTDDECRQKTFSLLNKSIFGYGVINN